MALPIQPTPVRIPILNLQFELTAKDKKVLAVALASILFFGVQFALSLPITFVVTLLISTMTYLAEKYIRTDPEQQNDWFNTTFDKKELVFLSTLLILRPVILQVLFWSLGIPLPALPQEGIAQALLAQPWRMIPLATIIAPIAEEILFRGFLLEMFESAFSLLNRHTFVKLSGSAQAFCSNAAQAVIFGVIHLNRKIKEAWKIPVVAGISLFGYVSTLFKREDKTLITPIGLHSANNAGAVIYIYASS